MQAVLCQFCWPCRPNTQRLAMRIFLGIAFPSLGRAHAVLAIYLGSGCKGPNLLGTESQSYQKSLRVPFLLLLVILNGEKGQLFLRVFV